MSDNNNIKAYRHMVIKNNGLYNVTSNSETHPQNRNAILINDPDVKDYIKINNTTSFQNSGISTKSDIVGEINNLNCKLENQKWRAFDADEQAKKLSIDINDYTTNLSTKSPKQINTPNLVTEKWPGGA